MIRFSESISVAQNFFFPAIVVLTMGKIMGEEQACFLIHNSGQTMISIGWMFLMDLLQQLSKQFPVFLVTVTQASPVSPFVVS